MAAEWVDTLVTGIVGVAGIFGTWLTGKQSRDQALKTLEEQLSHERLQAREAREQARLEAAYVELLKMAEQVGNWAQMVEPVVQLGEPPAIPLPSLDIQADVAALVNAYSSRAVRQRQEDWEAVVKQMIRQVELVEWEKLHPPSVGDPRLDRPYAASPRGALDLLRPQEAQTRRALAEHVRAELCSLYRSAVRPAAVTGSYTSESGRLVERGATVPEDASDSVDNPEAGQNSGTSG